MRKYMKRSAIIMVSVLVLSGCSGQKAVPSLEDAGNMTEEQLKQELSKFSRKEINAVWGEGTDPFSGRYGELFQLDGERTLLLCYEGDGQTVEDVIFGENCQTFMESDPLQLENQKSIQLLEKKTSDRIPMVMVDGNLYRSVGEVSDINGRCGVTDGEITSTVDGTEVPSENGQSNFGAGYGYQIVDEKHIDVYMPFGNSEEWVRFEMFGGEEPSVVKTHEVTDPELAFENDELVTMVKYYEMSDGTWKTDDHAYQYRLEITGRMGTAVKDTTFVFLSNIKDITFEQAWKASGLSSNMDDYFKEEDAKFVALR